MRTGVDVSKAHKAVLKTTPDLKVQDEARLQCCQRRLSSICDEIENFKVTYPNFSIYSDFPCLPPSTPQEETSSTEENEMLVENSLITILNVIVMTTMRIFKLSLVGKKKDRIIHLLLVAVRLKQPAPATNLPPSPAKQQQQQQKIPLSSYNLLSIDINSYFRLSFMPRLYGLKWKSNGSKSQLI